MTAYGVIQGVVQDSSGNAVASPTIEVRRESDNALATLFSDRVAATALGNSFTGNSDGTFRCYVIGSPQGYKVTATSGALSIILRNVPVGTLGEYDIDAQVTFTNTTDTDIAGTNGALNTAGGVKIGKSLTVEGVASGGFWLGTGSSNRIITINGGNSANGDGGAIQCDNAGAFVWGLGNISSGYGGAYNSDTFLAFVSSFRIGKGTPPSRTDVFYVNTGVGIGTMTDPGTGALHTLGKFGYVTGAGAGGTVTQLTDKSTGVTLDKVCGQITTHNATLNANTTVGFTLQNNKILSKDVMILNHVSGGTLGSYNIVASITADGFAGITIRNITAGNLGEALVIGFAVIKAATD